MSGALMRALACAALVAAATGCDTSACRGVDGTCVSLTVIGQGSVDGVQLTLSGAATGTRVAPAVADVKPLPVEIALEPPSAANGPLHIDAVAVLYGTVVGSGSADVTVSPGAHTSATVELAPGGSIVGGDGGALPFNVTATRVRHYQLADGGVVDVPGDETGATFAAEVPNGDGGVTVVAGSGDANGNLAIHRVPSAPYYLRFGQTYIFGSARTFDLGYWIEGRPDQTAPTKPTTLGFNLTNLAPWAATDTLELFSLNAGTAYFGLESATMGSGVTTLNTSIDLQRAAFGNLIDAAKGDDAFVLQLVADSNNGVPYTRLAKLVNLPPFTIADGGNQSISAAMSDVAQSGSLALSWTRSQFAQYRTAVNPQAMPDVDSFSLFAMPGGTAHGSFTSTPDVLIVQPPAGTTDVSLTASYGNPFPASWPLVGAAASTFAVSYTATGASAATYDGAIFAFAPLASLPSPVVPVISPVQTLTVDGQDALVDAAAASASASVAWSAPALGTPSGYSVNVYAIDAAAGKTAFDYVATLYTKQTSVSVPPGLLAGGQKYLFVVTAYADAIDRSTTPYLAALPTAYADALSGAVTVPLSPVASSCKDLHAAQPTLPDGIYTIDPDGSGAAPAVAVFCDMTTAGGGWTLCAWSKDNSAATSGFVPATTAKSKNWYGCQQYSAAKVDARVRVDNGDTAYTNQYINVDLRPSAGNTSYVPTPAAAPNLTLSLIPQSAACGASSANNFQWAVGTTESIYGLTPKDTCGTNKPDIFIGGTGVNTNGCWGANQISPQIGYPCGGYGDFGVHLELWVR